MHFPDALEQACQDIFKDVAASPHATELAAYVAGVWRHNETVQHHLRKVELKHHLHSMFAPTWNTMGNLTNPLICAVTHAVLERVSNPKVQIEGPHNIKVVPYNQYSEDWDGDVVFEDGMMCIAMLPLFFCDEAVRNILSDPLNHISVDVDWGRHSYHYLKMGKDPKNMIVVLPGSELISVPDSTEIAAIKDRVQDVFERAEWAEPYLEYFDEIIVDKWANITTVDFQGRVIQGLQLPTHRITDLYVDLME